MKSLNQSLSLSRQSQRKLRLLTSIVAGGALFALTGCGADREEEYTATTTDTTVASSATYPTAERTESSAMASSTATQPTATEAKDSQQIVLHEEELDVTKREVDAGAIVVEKDVVTEEVERPIELKREEVEVTHLSPEEANAREASGEAFTEDEIYIPLTREEAVVQKDVEAREVLDVSKETEIEQEQVTGTVRREVADVRREEGEHRDASSSQWTQAQQPEQSTEMASTQDLEQRIRQDLRNAEDINLDDEQLNQLEIRNEQGTVTIAGTVPNEQIARQIELKVSEMDGVEAVENELEAQDAGAVAE